MIQESCFPPKPGMYADLVIMDTFHEDPYRNLIESIDADFAAARKTFPKLNMMRLWMSLDGFISNPTHYAAQFDSMLALGPKHGIRFVVTLFNRWSSVPNW